MSSDNLIGTHIGEFTVHEAIGRGGMATVYRAHQPLMQRDVALKVILLHDMSDKHRTFAARFATEVSLIASLEHPNILPVYSYGVTDSIAYLVMRFLRGGSLEDILKGEPLPLPDALSLFSQIAHGLAHAHSKGIIHRDIKPSNILLDEAGHVYLTDFGLAKLIDADTGYTKTGQIMGTPVYMSPEQLKGEPLDFRSDVYALGCILYELLVGAPPFQPVDGDVIPVIFRHLETMPPPPSTLNPHLPAALDKVVLCALEKVPDDRFQSVREMANAALNAIGEAPTTSFPRPADMIVNRTRPLVITQRRSGLWIGLMTVLAMIVVGAAFYLAQTENARRAEQAAQIETMTVIAQQLAVTSATQTAAAFVPVYNPAQIILGEEARLEDLMPNDAELSIARRAFGTSGFIAIMPCNASSEYHAALVREISSFARSKGLSTRVYDPDSDAYRQLTLLERAIADNATAIILCPLDLELIAPTMQEVRRAGIPLVSQASNMGQYGGVQVLTDNTLLGRKPGEYIGKLVRDEMGGQAKVVVMAFDDLPDVKARADGMIDGMLEYAPDAEIVARVRGATPEWGIESIEALIADGVEFDVILSINDAGAFGAVTALENANVPYDEVIIGSVDGEILAQRYIREGQYFHATVEAGRTVYAGAAVDIIVKLLAGASIPEFVFIQPGELYTRETLREAQ